MVVSNNTLLNILIPHDNNALKEVLKEADIKTLVASNKNVNVSDILKNLFSSVQDQNKSNETITNLLKNSNLFKELGSFTTSLQNLIDTLPTNEKSTHLKSFLQNFLVNIEKLDDKSLKEQLLKSGIFLESKLNHQSNPNQKLENILMDIKNIVQNIPTSQAKNISVLVDKILSSSNPSDTANIKQLLNALTSLSNNTTSANISNLTALISKLQTITSEGKLVESKIQNSAIEQSLPKSQIITNTNSLLSSIKTELLNTKEINFTSVIKQIENTLVQNDPFAKSMNSVEPKNILTSLINNSNLQTSAANNLNLQNNLNTLQNAISDIKIIESALLNDKISPLPIEKIQHTIQESLLNIKQSLISVNSFDVKPLMQLIDKLLGINNLFLKVEVPTSLQTLITPQSTMNSFNSNFADNLNSIITSIKSSFSQNQGSFNTQTQLQTLINKVETLLTQAINPAIQNNTFSNNDMKAVLLQLQSEISTLPANNEALKHIDKLLTQVDYYQLLSITSNSSYVYLPFIWDLLEEGSISLKKSNEDRFYCEINLTLKEFGNINLMLSLYDKNHLDITAFASNDNFKKLVQENLKSLRFSLNKIGLIPVNIKIIELDKNQQTKESTQVDQFNQTSDMLNFGINIKA